MRKLDEGDIRAKHSEAMDEMRRRLNEKEKVIRSYRKSHGKMAVFFDEIEHAIRPLPPIPVEYRSSAKGTRVSNPVAAVMLVSDGHHGACQEPNEIEGFNEFNPEIGRARQLHYASDVVEWVELHRHSYKIDELHMLVAGDLVSGNIHQELLVTNAWPLPVQAVRAAELLAQQIEILVPHFSKIVVEFIVEDNHARLTKKPQCQEGGLNSVNYVVGHHAKVLVSQQKHVEFNIYPQYEVVVPVLNRRYLLCHGHGVRGWAGLPYYGIERKVARESIARLQIIMEDKEKADKIGFHRYVFGHWHVPLDFPLYMAGGSVSGTTAYDHKQGRHALPSQSAWLVHPKWGEFDRTNFVLEPR